MTAHEERRLRGLLGALRDAGIILPASFEPALPGYGFADVVDHLRGAVGAHMVGTGLAGGDRAAPGPGPEPAAVMPVWAFEPEGGSGDVLVSSAVLCEHLIDFHAERGTDTREADHHQPDQRPVAQARRRPDVDAADQALTSWH
jgi:hypothetical protein